MAGDIIDTGPHATMFKHSLGSKATERHYIFQVKYFARWLGLDDLEATLTFYNSDLNLLKQKIINYIMMYLEKDRKVAQNTRAARLNIIKQWYELAEVILPWKFIKTASLGKRVAVSTKDRDPTHDEIKALLSRATLQYQAIILFLSSTACRSGAIHDIGTDRFLRVGDLEEVEYKGQKTFWIHIYNPSIDASEEEETEYYTFCTPEAYDKIVEYWDYRIRAGEKSVIVDGLKMLEPRAPAFRTAFDKKNAENPRPLSHDTLEEQMSRIWQKSGKRKILRRFPSGVVRYEVKEVHGFRKFGTTQMAEAEVEVEKRKLLTGHSIGVQKAYAKYKREVLLKEHTKAWNKLSIEQSKYKVEQLEEENAQLQDEMTKQGNTLEYKYDQMARRNEELEKQVQDMMCQMKEFIESNKK